MALLTEKVKELVNIAGTVHVTRKFLPDTCTYEFGYRRPTAAGTGIRGKRVRMADEYRNGHPTETRTDRTTAVEVVVVNAGVCLRMTPTYVCTY